MNVRNPLPISKDLSESQSNITNDQVRNLDFSTLNSESRKSK